MLLSLLVIAQLSAGEAVTPDGLHGLGQTIHHEIVSEQAEHRYHVLVGLPADYDETAPERYPVVYILDGGALYPLLRGYQRYLRFGEETPSVILVGISYGTDDWQQGNNRSHDFTAPSEERDFWGGAGDFGKFLETELIPAIEDGYRADQDRRILFGQSLGGQFVLYAAQTKPALFWGYIASNPALHRNLEFFLETRPPAARDANLFVSSGSADDPRFREPALGWIAHWSAVADPPWRLETRTLAGHGHFSAPPAAYRAGMRWLFE
ncbi:MAG: alpha/beta hydrolase-fold protein [Pseudomonadota bacterium]